MTVNWPFGKFGSSGRIERLDFTTFGCGEEPTVEWPDNKRDWIPVRHQVVDGDELVTIVAVEDVDGVFAGSGDMSAIRGELDSPDSTVMFEYFEWADQSLSSRDAPDARCHGPVTRPIRRNTRPR